MATALSGEVASVDEILGLASLAPGLTSSVKRFGAWEVNVAPREGIEVKEGGN